MILNIFGPSGSGKTTLIKTLLKRKKTQKFYEKLTEENFNYELDKKISVSLIPLPKFRGSVREFFEIFSLEEKFLFFIKRDLKILCKSIFNELPNEKNLDNILQRQIETFSAGEMRRLFILKSLLVDSNILIIDEPFSNSDQKLWDVIYKSINIKPNSIILSHFSLIDFFEPNDKNISIPVSEIINKFKI